MRFGEIFGFIISINAQKSSIILDVSARAGATQKSRKFWISAVESRIFVYLYLTFRRREFTDLWILRLAVHRS